MAPCGQRFHVVEGDEVAAGVVGVDEQQRGDVFAAEEIHQVAGAVAEVVVGGGEWHHAALWQPVGIFLKGG